MLNVGENIIEYPGEVTTPTEYITTDKTLINGTISTPDAIFLCEEISSFYLNTPMDRYKYMKLTFDIILQEIIVEYKLSYIEHNGKFYIKI